MSKSNKLFILAGIVVPLSITVDVLAWIDGNLRTAIIWSILPIMWGFGLITVAWCYRKSRKEYKKLQNNKLLVVLDKPSHFSVLTISVVLLAIRLYRGDYPLYELLSVVCLMVVSGGILLSGGLLRE